MAGARRVHPFSPSKEPDAILDARTVGRDGMLALLDRRLRGVATTAHRPHTLIVGPRGAGKTHLLEVALHRARQDPAFRDGVVVVRFDEDMIGISRYRHILLAVYKRITGDAAQRPSDLESAIQDVLGDRPMIVVIENLDRLFRSLGESGQQELRAWVENSGQVTLLATAPLLFDGVSDRRLPWYGNVDIHHLDELDLEAGTNLLTRLAREESDETLADFLQSKRGAARLRVINLLAGGSPRIWMILFDCISVELLDELTPAVEALLEGLVPYYQQLLWDLPDNEQRIVQTLADGPAQAMTVSALADEAELDRRVAATSLGRLQEARWVRGEKPPGTDQRSTWYRLREPLLRHHLHYRSATEQPLALLVELLRAWFDPDVRRTHLVEAVPGSPSESLLARSLTIEPHTFDSAYADHDAEVLLAEARRWAVGEESERRTREAGALIEFCITACEAGLKEAQKTIDVRIKNGVLLDLHQFSAKAWSSDVTATVQSALNYAAGAASGRTAVLIELVAACWGGDSDPVAACKRLEAICLSSDLVEDDVLRLDVLDEYSSWTGKAGDASLARQRAQTAVNARQRVNGHSDPDTLVSRWNLAYWTRAAGDKEGARQLLEGLLPEFVNILGEGHELTLAARHHAADEAVDAGNLDTARDELLKLAADCVLYLGQENRQTMAVQHNAAQAVGKAGDPEGARDLLLDLLPICQQVCGAEDEGTLTARSSLAFWVGAAEDYESARDMYANLLPDLERIFGADDERCLVARNGLAHHTGWTGDAHGARGMYADLISDVARLGNTKLRLRLETELAFWLGSIGDLSAAEELLCAVIHEQTEVLGPDHYDTLTSRLELAYMSATEDDVLATRDRFVELAADHERVLGPLGEETLLARRGAAYWIGAAGDFVDAREHYDRISSDVVRGLGANHPEAIVSQIDRARSISRAGEPAAAIQQILAEMTRWQSDTGGVSPEVMEAAASLHLEYLEAVVGGSEDEVDVDGPNGRFLVDLREAVRGDSSALTRLPAELALVVESLRAGRPLSEAMEVVRDTR